MGTAAGNEAMIRLFNVEKRYGARKALSGITLEVVKNEFLFVSGPSGAGKTTLLKLLYLGEQATSGQILVESVNLSRIAKNQIHHLRRKFGIIFQDYKLIPGKTVYENLALVLEARGRTTRHVSKKVNLLLRTVGMDDRQKSYPPSLSGGEQQRVAVARALAGDPAIILADEPTGSLDQVSADIIMDFLIQYHQRGATVIIATHDKELIRKTGGRVVYLQAGQIESAATI